MANLELTDAQVFALLEQLAEEQKQGIAAHLLHESTSRPQPVFGSAKK